MIPDKDIPMYEAMMKYGGGFVKAIAASLMHADTENYQKLERAIPEYFSEYRMMAEKEDNCYECGGEKDKHYAGCIKGE